MTKINTAVEQTDFFSLFDIEDEYSKKKKKEEEERIKNRQEMAKKLAESTSTTSSAKANPVSKKLTINSETIILFFNEEIPVKEYFSDEELLYGISTKGKDGEEDSYRDIEARPPGKTNGELDRRRIGGL
ncbi:hypothetical protein [Oceanobacillus massiliensis]|uniref:hypothetical protein n=1 Tax=Oceanobacillus massiliensis TaxID=1465765 RepID=UPI00301883AC